MSIKSKGNLFLSLLIVVVLISGCFNSRTNVDKIYNILEQIVSSEKGFEEQQDPLITLEKKEKEIYDKIIGLGMKQNEQIVKLSDEAIKLADQRKLHMEQETTSIKKSEKKFSQIADLKNQLDNPEMKKQADELYTIMMKRYKAHETLNKEYSLGINYDKELYGMFKNKNLALGDLEAQVTKVNKSYEKINQTNEEFNKLTEEYNSKKLIFYKKAGLKIKQ